MSTRRTRSRSAPAPRRSTWRSRRSGCAAVRAWSCPPSPSPRRRRWSPTAMRRPSSWTWSRRRSAWIRRRSRERSPASRTGGRRSWEGSPCTTAGRGRRARPPRARCAARAVYSSQTPRGAVGSRYSASLADLEEVEVPRGRGARQHAWHLYPLRLPLDRLTTGRDEFIRTLAARGVGTSVHWRPLHMQPYYAERYGYREEEFPVAFREWRRLVSLPIFPGLSDADIDHVVATVRDAVAQARKRRVAVA